jgi:exodeoxyribonuclease VII small subunit
VSDEMSYEDAAEKLELTLKKMESDKLTLDEAVKAAEDAQRYLRIAAARLEEARKKIEVRAEGEPATE